MSQNNTDFSVLPQLILKLEKPILGERPQSALEWHIIQTTIHIMMILGKS